jgi:hypothetical protein
MVFLKFLFDFIANKAGSTADQSVRTLSSVMPGLGHPYPDALVC